MPTINDPSVVAEVEAAFDAYEQALVTNDVPALQNFFWNSPDAVRFGVSEQLYGVEQINAFRQNRIVDYTHRRGLRRTVTTLGSDSASVMFEFVSRPSQIERQGRQSQVWQRLDGEWKIISAHVSLAPPPPDRVRIGPFSSNKWPPPKICRSTPHSNPKSSVISV